MITRLEGSKNENELWWWVHEARLDYAVGKFDNWPERMDALKEVPLVVDGKRFYEVLEVEQLDVLKSIMCLGSPWLSHTQRQSIISKFPDIDWSPYTTEAYHTAFGKAVVLQPRFVKAMKKATKRGPNHPVAWKTIEQYHQDGIPVGFVWANIMEAKREEAIAQQSRK